MLIRILLADDHQMMREGLRALLETVSDFLVVAEAPDGMTAIKLAVEYAPHVVVMDIGLPHLNGIEATQRILSQVPDVQVVALSIHTSREAVINMLRAGALGYVVKECAFKELEMAIRTVNAGHTYLSPMITDTLLQDFRAPQVKANAFPGLPRLTAREREVTQLLAEGHTTKEIAQLLTINPKTVNRHYHGILEKLGLHNQMELIRYAIDHDFSGEQPG
jgi:DNA-binding NarL/FixJ family response regulator